MAEHRVRRNKYCLGNITRNLGFDVEADMLWRGIRQGFSRMKELDQDFS